MGDFGEISYDFGSINDVGTGLHTTAKNITSLLEDMEKEFQTFITSHWQGGQGNEAFNAVQTRWQGQSAELSLTLGKLGTTTVSAGEAMQSADGLAAKIIGG
ncbi:WXG100 family type VII secretion target [Nocardia transvalensis]|uniref:WXG100 family type VII secretion target n=1 Tax=Nocardia transvalensis TaxID=37333 RepID=A0A7W9PBQ6_9NOCA|nr:WXG100 family type VII secretion target [Nocardia transvalensis]MBB5912808.1 WXG100 family type VII secretion target [Nocardia transvalensis]